MDIPQAQVLPKRSASRSVSFDSDISSSLSCRADFVTSPLVTPTSPLAAAAVSPSSPSTGFHKTLRRSDALGPADTEMLQQKVEALGANI